MENYNGEWSRIPIPTDIWLQKMGFDTAENEPLKVWPALRVQIPQVSTSSAASELSESTMVLHLPRFSSDNIPGGPARPSRTSVSFRIESNRIRRLV